MSWKGEGIHGEITVHDAPAGNSEIEGGGVSNGKGARLVLINKARFVLGIVNLKDSEID